MELKTFKIENTSVKAPASWSSNAVEIAASKYFRRISSKKKESSVVQLIDRVNTAVSAQVKKQGLLPAGTSSQVFEKKIRNILLDQKAAFNSPVWFNVGLFESYGVKSASPHWVLDLKTEKIKPVNKDFFKRPQASACFIQSGPKTPDEVLQLAEKENLLFRYGSGTGSNFSTLPSKLEEEMPGVPSPGILNFLDFLDRGAGMVKSGGVARRAAKMVVLNVNHPEIIEFIRWKMEEERKAKTLIAQGFDPSFEGEVYKYLSGQNANNSVRVTDKFMESVKHEQSWSLAGIDGKQIRELPAKDIWQALVEAAWYCADPGIQFHDTINQWNPCRDTMEIHASNPCSEYMFIDDSACNLASINLCQFLSAKNEFNISDYVATIDHLIRCQEALVDYASYPTEKIAQNSHDYRPLGLGYANLGALIMRLGLSYDSEEGRCLAALLASLMTAKAYHTSCLMAQKRGSFKHFRKNKKSFLRVLGQHQSAHNKLYYQIVGQAPATIAQENLKQLFEKLFAEAETYWAQVLELASKTGVRNAQVTLLAPTGTIGLLMDCDTLGIEPEFSLLKHKVLSGGGEMRIENRSVEQALGALGKTEEQKKEILDYLSWHGYLQGAPHLNENEEKVFSCATGPGALTPLAHVQMMAGVQPFLSGAISKTVNCPENTSLDQISELYFHAWRLGLKSVAVYRDGSKGSQPLHSIVECGTGECVI